MAATKIRYLQIRLTEEDEALLDHLTSEYGLDRSNLVRRALEYVNETKPVFKIIPQGKEIALAEMVN